MNFKEWLGTKTKLSEMPIGNAELIGKWDQFPSNKTQHQNWDKASYNILTNDPGLERLKNRWQKVKQTFDMYFIKQTGMKDHTEIGEVTEDYLSKLGIKIPPINYEHITVFFTNNTAAEKIPMTPWTVGHRFGHAIIRGDGPMRKFQNIVSRDFGELLKIIYNKNAPSYGGDFRQYEKFLMQLMMAFGTMRSAREGLINRIGEFSYELLGQFIIDGKITFKEEVPRQLAVRYAWGRPTWDGSAYSKIHNDEPMIDHVIDTLRKNASDYNRLCNGILDNCVGKIFVM